MPKARNLMFALACAIATLPACGPADQAKLLVQAKEARQKGELKAAIIHLKNALQKSPDDPTLRLLLGETYLDQGDAVSAEKELRKAASLGAASAAAKIMLGRALLAQGQFEKVLDAVPGGGKDLELPIFLALRATALLGMSKMEDARSVLDQAERLQANSPDVLLAMARLALLEQRNEAAVQYIERALSAKPTHIDSMRLRADLHRQQGQADAAMAVYQSLLKVRPGDGQTLIDMASLMIDGGKFNEARAALASARKAAPLTIGLIHTQAMLEYREGKYRAALELLQQVLRVEAEHYPSILLLGAVEIGMGSPALAEQHVGKFLAAFPQHPLATKLMVSIKLQAGQAEQAISLIMPVLAKLPDDPDLLALAGEAHLRAKHFSRATEYFEKANALQPNSPMLATALGLSRLGNGESARAIAELERAAKADTQSKRADVLLVMAHLRAGAGPKALAAVQEMEKKGNNPLVQNLKGGVYLAQRDLAQARAGFEAALKLDASFLPALDNLAQLDVLEKHPEQAQKRYQAALEKSPDPGAIMESLSRLYTMQGNLKEAKRWLEQAVEKKPDSIRLALRLAEFMLQNGEAGPALKYLQSLQASHADNPDVLGMLARAFELNDKRVLALEQYDRLASLSANGAGAHMQAARLRLEAKDLNGALESLRKALLAQPGLIGAQSAKLSILIQTEKFTEAMAFAKSVQKQQADSAAGYGFEGDVHMAQKHPDLAVKVYEQGMALSKTNTLMSKIHAALLQAGRAKEADTRLAQWLKDHEQDQALRLYYASSKLERKDFVTAIGELELVLKREPNNVIALNDLAWAYQEQGDKRASTIAERAYAQAKENPLVIDTLAWIYARNGDPKRALPLAKKARDMAPAHGEVRYHFAAVLAQTGDKAAAKKELQALLAEKASFAKRDDAAALLRSL